MTSKPHPQAGPTPGDVAPAQAASNATSKTTITIADLVGTWGVGDSSVVDLVDFSSGDYRGTKTSFYAESYAVSANGSFNYKFVGRTSTGRGGVGGYTVKENDAGTISFNGEFVVLGFKGRAAQRMRFISYFTEANGRTHMTLVPEDYKMDAESIAQNCGPPGGPISRCIGGASWTRAPGKPKK